MPFVDQNKKPNLLTGAWWNFWDTNTDMRSFRAVGARLRHLTKARHRVPASCTPLSSLWTSAQVLMVGFCFLALSIDTCTSHLVTGIPNIWQWPYPTAPCLRAWILKLLLWPRPTSLPSWLLPSCLAMFTTLDISPSRMPHPSLWMPLNLKVTLCCAIHSNSYSRSHLFKLLSEQ